MKINEFQNLKIKNGAFTSVEYCSYPKPLKAYKGHEIKKVTKGIYRLGIAYKNLASKKDIQTEKLPYGQWVDNWVNKLIERDGKYQLRLYMTNNRKHKSHTKWYLDGQEITKQELIEMGAISESNSNHIEMFNVHLENVIRIGKATE